MKLEIRKASPGDLSAIAAIEKESFALPWSEDALGKIIAMPEEKGLMLAASADGEIIGFSAYLVFYDEVNIINLAVSKPYRRLGAGTALMKKMLAGAHASGYGRITLEVRRSNAAAIALYEQSGFVSVGVRRGYYTDNNEDAFIMWYRGEK